MQRPKNAHDTPVVTADIAKKHLTFAVARFCSLDTTAVFMVPLGTC